jgi:RND superfamily putative drug exporter
MLLSGLRSAAALVARVALVVWMVFFSAFDAIAGIATGVLARHAHSLSGDDQAGVISAVNFLFDDSELAGGGFSFLGNVGHFSWVVVAIAATVALYKAGASRLAVGAMLLSVLFASHAGPGAAAGLVGLFVAELLTFRKGSSETPPTSARKAEPETRRQEPAHDSLSEEPVAQPVARATPTNLPGRVGRWSARHRKTAIFGWLAFVAAALALGTAVGTTQIDPAASGVGESGRVDRILHEEFDQPAAESVLVQSDALTVDDPAFAAAVEDVVARVSALEAVSNVRSPLDPENSGQIGQSGHAVLIDFEITGDPEEAVDKIDPVVAAVEEAQTANPDVFVGSFGVSADKEINAAFMDDLKKAGLLSIPVTLIILIVVFGALVAAGVPLLLALTSIAATFGLVALPSSLVPVDQVTYELILLIGLAVGVDYSMFYLKREREERAAGRSSSAALEAAAATSGRSVLISGLTVIIAMSGLFLAGIEGMSSFAVGTILVVAVAMLGSLTVLPATLSWLGDRVEKGRVPLVRRLRRDDGEGRIWGAILSRVLRRPVLSATLAAGLLLALAVPALQLRTVQPGVETYPQNLPSVQSYNRIQAAFPGAEIPAAVVIQTADVSAPAVQEAIGQLEWRALASGQMHEPITVDVNETGTVATVAIPVEGKGMDSTSEAALAVLRDEIVPATVGALPNAEVGVTGMTAQSKDFNDKLASVAPLVFGFVLLLAFLLMLFAFRSLAIAIKAIVLNLLSIAAAYGVMVLVFQHGWGKGLLGFESTAGIDAFLPVFMFVILFGLSMDYHVFIISRIREAYDRGMSTEEAIGHGIKTTAGVVTSAALVMVCVFAVFATLSMMIFKQFGVGLAAAILIDATIVRAVLLPATMKLLGDWNWYLPSWLEWLPHLDHGDGVPVKAPAVPTPTA